MNRERGQATVEFALVSITLLLLFFALIDGARAVYTYQTVGEAARVGAHSAELVNSSDAQIRASIDSHSGYLGGLGASATISPASSRVVGQTVTLSVKYQFRTITPFLSQLGPTTISSQTTVVVE
jgi:Flp pilus assembly protein TadG